MKKFISLSLIMYVIWLAMAGIQVEEMVLGAVVCLILAYILGSYVNISFSISGLPRIIIFISIYIPVLMFELVKANLDVARRVLNPKLPIRPGVIKVKTAIQSDFGKLVLANSITLTPGTISLDADQEGIYVHCIDVENSDLVASNFEKVLGRVYND